MQDVELLHFKTAFDLSSAHSGRFGINQEDPRIEEILIKMQELLTENRLLRKRHDELAEEYFELKREFEERAARRRTAV